MRRGSRSRATARTALILLAGLIQPAAFAQALSSAGTDFWLGFTLFDNQNPTYPRLMLTAESDAQVSVQLPAAGVAPINVTVPAGKMTEVVLSPNYQYTVTPDSPWGIHVVADQPVSVTGYISSPYSSESYLGLPRTDADTEYLVAGWNPNLAPYYYFSEMIVVASENDTTVTIEVSDNNPCSFDVATRVLQKGHTTSLGSCGEGDVTGTFVSADKPVSVLSGHLCGFVPDTDAGDCNPLLEQMAPTATLGTRFVITPVATRPGNDIFRVIAGRTGGDVMLDGVQVTALLPGQYYEFVSGTAQLIETTMPVLVEQYAANTQDGSAYDGVNPFMMGVPPVEQYLDHTPFAVSSNEESAWANIVVNRRERPALRLDGRLMRPALFEPVAGAPDYVYARVKLAPGQHELSGGLAGVTVYGESFGNPAAQALAPIATVATLTIAPLDSAIDGPSCVVAQVADRAGRPLSGVRVDFEQAGRFITGGYAWSDADGAARYCGAARDDLAARVGGIRSTGSTRLLD